MSEIERLLDCTASRSTPFVRRDGTTFWPRVLVVVGGRFAALWGDHDLAGPSGADAWQNADHEPLADVHAVSSWLMEHSNLPAGIQRRLAPEPLVLGRVQDEEASQLSVQIHRSLPPLLDGISVDELTTALQGPRGWQAVASVIEEALVAGHENIVPLTIPPRQLRPHRHHQRRNPFSLFYRANQKRRAKPSLCVWPTGCRSAHTAPGCCRKRGGSG